jgi:hypothetical protein
MDVASAALEVDTQWDARGANRDRVVTGWCQQFPPFDRHRAVRADGYLYAGAGDGASFDNVDYGQYGSFYAGDKANPCGDPPSPAGTALSPPGAEGGALRSQSVRRTDGPTTLNGAILRVDPATGAGVATNPWGASTGPNKRRVLAYGLRNPFRFTTRPGTNELWIGDVGSGTWEEIDRVADTTGGTATNFGWPCYEGSPIASGFQAANVTMQLAVQQPVAGELLFYSYKHSDLVVSVTPARPRTGRRSAAWPSTWSPYPASYNGGLFFADHSRRCIWFMPAGVNGVPDPLHVQAFEPAAGNPVDLEIGPGGDLFYADLEGGSIHRIRYLHATNKAVASSTAADGGAHPDRAVRWRGSIDRPRRSRADSMSGDLGGNGVYDNGNTAHRCRDHTPRGVYTARLRASDPQGARSVRRR